MVCSQELIFTKYGPELAKKLKKCVTKAITGLRDYLGEYRVLPEDEEMREVAKRQAVADAAKRAEDEKIAAEVSTEQMAFIEEHERQQAEKRANLREETQDEKLDKLRKEAYKHLDENRRERPDYEEPPEEIVV